MHNKECSEKQLLPNGVMFNAYPDSIGTSLEDCIYILKMPQFRDAFSLFYILPTFFNSDLDRGFSIIDYDLNRDLVSDHDLEALHDLGITLKLDMILNHLSVNSPQFRDLQAKSDFSVYKDFFIDWNNFWEGKGSNMPDGLVIPENRYMQNLFTRKPGLPVMKVEFDNGEIRYFWNTFYQEIIYDRVYAEDFTLIPEITPENASEIAAAVNDAFLQKTPPDQINLGAHEKYRKHILPIIKEKRNYLGQLDLNARSEKVWDFYSETLQKLQQHGAKIIRLDAFAYLHKEPGYPNFFNRPGTWDYLDRLRKTASTYGLVVFPEIHAEYGTMIHNEVASKGYPIYDFFFPGLMLHTLERRNAKALKKWIKEILQQEYQTINMLGCHDGIPVLDLKGKEIDGSWKPGLLENEEIESLVDIILARGGLIKNLYGPDGRKISYYQVNATFFSALGENYEKLLLARAIQLFMPGIPQIWYLDLFAGKNDYEAVEKSGPAGHKEINRTTLSLPAVKEKLQLPVVNKQLEMIRFRNSHPAFTGQLEIKDPSNPSLLQLCWEHNDSKAELYADLNSYSFQINYTDQDGQVQELKL